MPATGSVEGHSAVGKATVERMMAETRRDSRKNVIVIGVALLVVIAVAGASLAYWWNKQSGRAAAEQPPSKTEIAKRNTPAVVYMEAGWELIHTPSGGKVYQEYMLNLNPLTLLPFIQNGKRYVAVYIQFPDGSIEPSLTTSAKTTYDDKGDNQPVADTLAGSGFVVDSNGFILTNRHVAAAWTSRYNLSDALPGLIFRLPNQTEESNQEANDRTKKTKGKAGNKTALYGGLPIGILKELTPSLQVWNPSESKVFGGKPIKGKLLDGRNVYFEVTFAGTENPYNAALVRQSSSHDVALVKIEAPQSVAAVEMNDNYDQAQPGDEILIMGYPLVSPDVVASTKSHDPFNRTRQFKVVPAPTVTDGIIGKLLRDESSVGRRESRDLVSEFGDSYQLTTNSTGAGNSGGPLFDKQGRVIGIFYARSGSAEGTAVTFAVPIRYGMQLMRTAPVGR
jgi:S1-C subfamily serine protease